MSDLKAALIEELIKREGGYANNPADRGGETMYGITKAVALDNGYTGAMSNLPYIIAFNIYERKYWKALKLEQINKISSPIALQLFDFGVNSGVHSAAQSLQKILNVLNKKQAHYHDLLTDGILGSKTLIALNKFAKTRGPQGLHVLSEVLRGKRISFCVDIALNDESQEIYTFGWFDRIVNL